MFSQRRAYIPPACLASAALLALTLPLTTHAESEQARELARQVHERPEGDDATTVGTMTLQEDGGRERVRETVDYRLDLDDGTRLSMIRFLSPGDVRNTGLLMHEHPDGSSDQWLYLPAADTTRRVASGRRGGRFVGSDLYFEDLEDRNPRLDTHRITGEDEYEGTPVTVMESTPRDADESVYDKRVSWIHEQTMIPLRIDFYEDGDEPTKRWEVGRIDRIQDYWTIMTTTVTDLASGHSTTLRVDEVIYDQDLPEDLFETRVLSDPARESRYRP